MGATSGTQSMAAPTPWATERFCRQYLQVEKQLDYPPISELRLAAVQDFIYQRLFGNTNLELPPAYTFGVLKTLTASLEEEIDDWDQYGISDALMDKLGSFAGSSALSESADPSQKYAVQYCVSDLNGVSHPPAAITLLENRSTISSSGTTGFRTWEAALHLGSYLCHNRQLVQGKQVLELGAGTGYISILCAKYLAASHCVASDGSWEVVQNLQDNFARNGLDDRRIAAEELKWGTDTPVEGNLAYALKFNVILGADITFDERDMPSLLSTLESYATAVESVTIVIASTERNEKTFKAFVFLAKSKFSVSILHYPLPKREVQNGPFYSDSVPIHICLLTKLKL